MGRISVSLGKLPTRVGTKKEANMRKAGQYLAERIVENVSRPGPSRPGEFPGVKKGRLRRSIKVRAERGHLRVIADVPYASYLENGTRRMAARPFMQRTYNQHRRAINRIIRTGR